MSALKPDVDSLHDLGSTTLRWRNLFVDAVTVTDDVTVAGNLTVEGTTTSIETTNLQVEDPLIKLNKGSTAAPASDLGLVFSRGDGTNADQANRVLVWDESEDEFAFAISATEDGTTVGNVAISGYSDVAVGKLVFDSAAGDNIEIDSSNLTLSATADIALKPGGSDVLVTGNILPVGDDTYDLGSAAAAWKDLFLEGDITLTDAGTIATSAGALTVNGAEGIVLQEAGSAILTIDTDTAVSFANLTTLSATPSSTIDLDAGGAITIDGQSLAIGGDSDTGAITIDSTAGISLDGAADSNFTLSDGDLSLIADGADNKVVIKGDHSNGVAIHLDGNAEATSIVDIDAGVLDIDTSGAVQIDGASLAIGGTSIGAITIDSTAGISLDGAAASNFTTSGGDLSLIADGADAKVVIKGDATSAESDVVSIHLDGDIGTRSVVDIDAGILDIDASASVSIDAATAISIESSGGAISVGANAVAQNINVGTGAAGRTISVGNASSTKLDLKAADIDVAAGANGFAVAGGGASSLSTSSGALNITAAAASTWQTSVGALNITGAAASTWQTSGGALNITGAAASTWQTSAGALTINGAGGLNLQEGGADVIAIDDNKDVLFSHTGGDSDDPDVEFDGYVRFDGAVELDSTVQLDGAVTFNNTLTVGADDTGHDVTFYGATAGKHLLWDESADELALIGNGTKLSFFDAAGGENISADNAGILSVNAGAKLAMTSPILEVTSTTEVTLDTPRMVVSSSTSAKPVLELKNTNDDATGPTLKLALDTANSAASNDVAGTIEFFADDDANNNQSYGEIKVVAADVTSASESGKMTFGVATTTDGSVADIVSITGGATAATSTVQILGNLSVIGTTTTVDQGTMLAANSVTFEGSTTDEHETVLTIADPTADRTITLPDLSGHVPLLAGAVSNSNVTAAEFALLDGGSTVSEVTIADGDGIFTNDGGTMKHVRVQDFQTYFDGSSVGGSNIVTVGALDAGSITSGFGSINTGASDITTTGQGNFGSLDVDNVFIDGANIGFADGVSDDLDLLTLASGALTLKGTLEVGVNDTGHDVTFYGATAGSKLVWDESADSLLLTDSTPLKIGDAQDMTLYHDGTDSYITNAVGALKIATETAGIAVTIGNADSTTTIGQDLAVTRNLTAAKATVENIDLDNKTITMTGSPGDTASFVVAENGALSITTVDANAAAANMSLVADGTFEAVGTTITLDSGGAINLDPAAGSAIVLDGLIEVDGGEITGATSISSTAFVGTLSTAAQGNVTSLGTLTGLNVDGDATFTGAAANMVWDQSDNALEFADSAKLLIGAHGAGTGDLELYHDGTDSHVVSRTGTLNIANAVNVPISIGHASSTTTVGGALSVTGNIDSAAGDLSVATITMTGFTVDADGDTALKSLAVDTGSTIGCDADSDLMTLSSAELKVSGDVLVDGTTGVNSGSNDTILVKHKSGATIDTAIQVVVNDAEEATGLNRFKVDSSGNVTMAGTLTVSNSITSSAGQLQIADSLVALNSGATAGVDIGVYGKDNNNKYLGLIYDTSLTTPRFRLYHQISTEPTTNSVSFGSGEAAILEVGGLTTDGAITHSITETTSAAYTVDNDQSDYIINATHQVILLGAGIAAPAGRELVIVNTSGSAINVTTNDTANLYVGGTGTGLSSNHSLAANSVLKIVGVGGDWYAI